MALPCLIRLILITGFSLLTQITNTSFSHIEPRLASTFLENCPQFLHNPQGGPAHKYFGCMVFLNGMDKTASESTAAF
jgi:hypothetical protein